MKISAFADEIYDNFEEQLIYLNKRGIEYIEVRGVNGKSVSSLTEDEIKTAKTLLDKYGVKVSAIGSPIGKIKLTDDFDAHIKVFKNVMKTAKIFDTELIRIFSFYLPDSDWKKYQSEVFEKLQILLDLATAEGLTLCHENEREIYGESPEACLDIMQHFNGKIKFVFDPANFVVGGHVPYPKAFNDLKKYIKYMHIKDARKDSPNPSDDGIYPAGGGDGHIPEILRELKKDGFDGILSIEPHLSVFTGINQLEAGGENKLVKNKFNSKQEAFDTAHDALVKIISAL